MGDKPIIRHCKNCEYCGLGKWGICEPLEPYCEIRYIYPELPRLRALLCRFYKPKGEQK
jgi:hypothetical protein